MACSMRWAGRMACMGDGRGAYRDLMEILERRERGTTWNTRRRWKDNIKTDLRVVGWGGMDGEAWTGLIWLRIRKVGGHL